MRVLDLLTELARDFRLGLITNGAPGLQWEKINGAGIGHYFEHIVISGDIGIGKPEPEIFLAAVEKFGVDRRNFVMIGDALGTDIPGAQNVGIKTIWVNRNGAELEGDIKPDKIIRELSDLPEIIKRIL